jgi:hypothetical protein
MSRPALTSCSIEAATRGSRRYEFSYRAWRFS